MDHYKETSETWNKISQLYQEKFMEMDFYNSSYDFFCEALPLHSKVLDIGCGPGNISKYLKLKRSDLQLEGIDVAPNMIALARQNVPDAQFKVMDVRSISSLKSEFQGIICGFCLPYLAPADAEAFISDVSNLLLPNGIFYLSFVAGNPSESGFKTGSSGDRVYFYYYELEYVLEQLSVNGFESPTILEINYPLQNQNLEVHTVLMARKI